MEDTGKAKPPKSTEQSSYELTEMKKASIGLVLSIPGPPQTYPNFPKKLLFYGIFECVNQCVSDSHRFLSFY